MSRTVVDIDDQALPEAMKRDQTETNVDVVNRAHEEMAERRARRLRRAFEIWDEMAADMGKTDWDGAWRRSR